MKENTTEFMKKIFGLIEQVKELEIKKVNFIKYVDKGFKLYQKGKISFDEYKKEEHNSLKGKNKEYWVKQFDAKIYAILKLINYQTGLLHEIVYREPLK